MATEVEAQPVRWLWQDQLALGKIAVVAGAANVGKSLLVTGDFAARVSVGAAWPDGSPCPARDVLDSLVEEGRRSAGQRDAAATTFIADFLKDGPRGWAAITQYGKAAGHKPGTLERVRAIVAETFKRKGQEGRWLWRLIGDDRTSSEGDIADFFGADEIGLPNFDVPSFQPLPPLPAGAHDNDEDQDDDKNE